MFLADALSRLPSSENKSIQLDLSIEHHGFTSERIQQISKDTQADPILGVVYQFTTDGWPLAADQDTVQMLKPFVLVRS